jgi:fatty-acyl-CoA synthase
VGAFIILNDDSTRSESDIIDYCRGKIARFKIPKYVFFVNGYPMTASGKIQKYKLGEKGLNLLKEKGTEII